MKKNEKKEKIKKVVEQPSKDSFGEKDEVIVEVIKKKRAMKNRLLKHTLNTAVFAGVFGIIASFTFLVLQPLANNWLYPNKEEKEIITLPAEADEIRPEDMLLVDETIPTVSASNENTLNVEDIQKLYGSIYDVVTEASKYMVTVTGVKSDIDWFNNPYESKGTSSGVIIAKSATELVILVDETVLKNAESIHVTFTDGTQAVGTLLQTNSNAELAVVSVALDEIEESTKEIITVATFASSTVSSILASPVIAIGSPNGYSGAIAYGMITSIGNKLMGVDNNFTFFTTDIYGSRTATGAVINLKGQVVGMIHQNEASSDMSNCIVALGMSDLRNIAESMSNSKELPRLGICGMDVSEEANANIGVPFGAYVVEVEIDSPAMQAGIQSGDVIVALGQEVITYFSDYTKALYKKTPGDSVKITVMRQGRAGYSSIDIVIITDELK